MSSNYLQSTKKLYQDAIDVLVAEGIDKGSIDFTVPHEIPRRPTQAFSDFLINKAMGDWAEEIVHTTLKQQLDKYCSIRYGHSGDIIAGDPTFKQFFLDYHSELGQYGKRPDILIMPKQYVTSNSVPDNISDWDVTQLVPIAKAASLGIEVRSSKYYQKDYTKLKGKEQSYTPKLEDIKQVMRWIVFHETPHCYCQTFLDGVFTISFQKILEVIIDTGMKYLKKVKRSQEKWTFYIPLSEGNEIGKFSKSAKWESEVKRFPDGRVQPFARPINGVLSIDVNLLKSIYNL